MTTALLDYRGNDHTSLGWNKIANTAIADLVVSDGSTQTGWSLGGDFGLPAGTGGATSTSGNAAWVNPSVVSAGSRLNAEAEGVYKENTVSNLNDAKTYTVECFSSGGSVGRVTRWRVNGATQDLASDAAGAPNSTDTVTFSGVAPVAGVITIGFTKAPGSGTVYASAVRVIEAAGPSLTATQTEITPGSTISGTTANYATTPTVLSVSEGTNRIGSDTGEITGLTITAGATGVYDWTATMPALPTTGSAAGIRFTDAAIVELT